MNDDLDDATILAYLEQLEQAEKELAKSSSSSTLPSSFSSTLSSGNKDTSVDDIFGVDTVLNRNFGFEFRGQQKEVILEALYGRDVGVYWSTGSGKSLCYLLPSLVNNKITIVISPMISLMQDQVRSFNLTIGRGQELAVFLGSGQVTAVL